MADKQLTFGSLRQSQRAVSFKANPSTESGQHKRLKHQAVAILKMLEAGPIWTNQLAAIAKQYNARIKEIREMLQPQGKTVDCTFKGKDGNNRYEITSFYGSNYQKYLMTKQKAFEK